MKGFIAIIDYGLGNLTSVKNAFESLGAKVIITSDPIIISRAEKIILPGVGAFKEGMQNLKRLQLIDVLTQEVIQNKKPFLGICLGMQLICSKGFEGGESTGLGWIDAEVVSFEFQDTDQELRVPHVGWNDVDCTLTSPIFNGGNQQQHFYFVHSYYVKPKKENISVGSCVYGVNFCAVLQQENIFATQFHPEKSQYEGLEILRKFAEL